MKKLLCSLLIILSSFAMAIHANAATVTYASYTGVNYQNIGLSSDRVAALNKAREMVCIQWTATESFHTWLSSKGVYNTVVATDGTSSTSFLAGKTYRGIPYSMADHSFDNVKWKNYVESNNITAANMNGKYYSSNNDTTAHGIDCSYFVFKAIEAAVGSNNISYQVCSSMMNSTYYERLSSRSEMLPGDLFLNSGHVMMFVGKSGNNYAVFEADADDSKCSYNTYSDSSSYLASFYCYRFRGFNGGTSTHTEDPVYASLKGTKVIASKEILVHEGNHAYYDRGTRRIDAGDECTIEAIYTDGCCKVTYPSSSAPGGYRTLYAQKSDFNLPSPTPNNHDPYGYFDVIEGGAGTIRIVGWAKDDDTPNQAVEIHVYVDDPYDLSKCIKTKIYANSYRSDGGIGYHGFDETFATNIRGTHNIYVYAINTTTGNNPLLENCPRSVTVTEAVSAGEQILPNGDYIIATACTTNKAELYYLDIYGSDTSAPLNTNVHIHGPVSGVGDLSAYDVWTISYSGGFYTIKQKGSSAALDVTNASTASGANIAVHASNGSAAQQWKISKMAIGYRVQAKCSGLSLDAAGGVAASGTNVQQHENNDSPAQAWLFIPYKPSQPVGNGRYIMLSGINYSYELDAPGDFAAIPENANAQIWNDVAQSRYNAVDLVKLSNGYYKIKHAGSGRCLDVTNGLTQAGSNIAFYTDNGSITQQWAILSRNGAYAVVSRCSGFALDVDGGKAGDGKNIMQYYYHGASNQLWNFVPAEYTVSYDANGGTGAPGKQTKYYKESLTLSTTKPTRANYTFLGWATSKTATSASYQPGGKYTQEANVTLYAVWKMNAYTVTYNANAGSDTVTGMPQSQEKIHGTNLKLSDKVPTRAGYTFLGWATSADSSWYNYLPGDIYKNDSNCTLYARWMKDGAEMSSGQGRSLIDGDYLIVPTNNTGFFLDILGQDGIAQENQTVSIYTRKAYPSVYDVFTLTYLDNGFYSIVQKGTNMALSVENDSVSKRANVVMHTYTGSTGQQWSIGETYTGDIRKGMKLEARCSGFMLDIRGSSYVNEAVVQVFSEEKDGVQSWVLIPYEAPHTLPDGRYVLVSNMEEDWELGVGDDVSDSANVQIWNDSGDDYAEGALSRYNAFDVEYIGEGYYKLIHTASGKALSVSAENTVYSTNICVSDYTGSAAQQWAIMPEGDTWVLLARNSGYAMDVSGAVAVNGGNVMQYRYGGLGNKHQQWNLVPAEYTVQYSANGGTDAPEVQTKYYKGNLTLSDAVPIHEDYVFAGWNTMADGSGSAYASGEVYRADEAVTLYAQWRKGLVLRLPAGLRTIEDQAFEGIAADVIVIPEGCLSIGSEAFLNCKALVKLYIPASVSKIAFDAFDGCDNLTIHAPESSVAARMAVRLGIEWVND